jgi:hypothetical protein
MLHIWIAIVASVAAESRPTPDTVAKAIEVSKASYAASHPGPTTEEVLQGLQKQLAILEVKRKGLIASPGSKSRNAELKSVNEILKGLKQEVTDVKSGKIQATSTTPPHLDVLSVKSLATGNVGFLGSDPFPPPIGKQLGTRYIKSRCRQIVNANEAILEIEEHLWYTKIYGSSNNGQAVRSGPDTRVVGTAEVWVVGIKTDGMVEGNPVEANINVVSLGNRQFTTAIGGRRTVPVLEVFDPDKPFK